MGSDGVPDYNAAENEGSEALTATSVHLSNGNSIKWTPKSFRNYSVLGHLTQF